MGWECPSITRTLVEFAPIIAGLVAVLATMVWVMTREGESDIAIAIQLGMLYIIIVVMMIIIFGILG